MKTFLNCLTAVIIGLISLFGFGIVFEFPIDALEVIGYLAIVLIVAKFGIEKYYIKHTNDLKRLFIRVLNNQDCFKSGLCLWIWDVGNKNVLNYKQCMLLENYIKVNLLYGSYYNKNIHFPYYWEYGQIQPRIDWIDEQIKKLS